MTNPAPLSVDPDQLAAAGGELASAAADLPPAPPPFMPVGTDPLSAAIIGQIPAVEGPVMTELPAVKTQATETANNVVNAAKAYATTDQQLGGQISQEMQNPASAAAAGSGGGPTGAVAGSSAGSAAGSMGQMMGMPMQMAGQMAQMPQQVMGAVAAVPQGVMQGAQQVQQQVQQMVGQFGGGGASGSQAEAPAGGGLPGAEAPSVEQPKDDHDGAAASEPGAERAPETKDKADVDTDTTAPGRHRRPEPSDPGIDV